MSTTFLNGTLQNNFPVPNPVLDAQGGNDTIVTTGDLSSATILAGVGNDTVAYGGGSAASDLTDGGDDDDYIVFNSIGSATTSISNSTVYGGLGSDRIYFGYDLTNDPPNFPFSGGKLIITNSLIRGFDNQDPELTFDDSGDDIFFGEDTLLINTFVNGNKGDDDVYAYGTLRSSTIQGGQNSDYIGFRDISGSRINGNLGNDDLDTYDAAIVNSSVFGGKNDDHIDFTDTTTTNTLVNGDDDFDYIHFFNGGWNGDYLVFADNSTILGGAGKDYIEATAIPYDGPAHGTIQNKSIFDGGTGNDSIFIGEDVRVASQSSLLGGDGFDNIRVDESFDGWGGLWNSVVDGGADDDQIYIGEIGDSFVGATSIYGGSGNDYISGDNWYYDKIYVGAYWSGDDGNDTIIATDGQDTVSGGSGADIIHGEEKGDTLTGGSGNDIFVYYDADESYVNPVSSSLGSNIDTITDFNADNADRFDVNYDVYQVISYSQVGWNKDWETTIDFAQQQGGYLQDNQVGVLKISSGDTNAGTYLLFLEDGWDNNIGWSAYNGGIIRLTNPTGDIGTSNFVVQ